jgi:hypothetical protein
MLMTFRRLRIILGVVFLLTFFCLQPAYAAKASRIELKSGEVYEDVTFSIDDVFKVITIEKGDWKINANLPDVLQIIDENSQDVTADYLGDYYEPPQESEEEWLSREKAEQKGYSKKPFDFAIGAGGNFSIPTGDYYKGTKSGIGFGFDVVIPVTRNLAIKGIVSKSGMRQDLASTFPPGIMVLDDDLSVNVWRYIAAAQYYKWPKWRTSGKTMYYASVGMGAITHEATGTMTFKNTVTDEIGIIYGTGEKENKFIISYGAGLVVMLSKQIGLDLGATWDVVFAGTENERELALYGDAEYANIFDLKIALVGLF